MEQSAVREERSRENEMRRERSIDQAAVYDSFFVRDQRMSFHSFLRYHFFFLVHLLMVVYCTACNFKLTLGLHGKLFLECLLLYLTDLTLDFNLNCQLFYID